MSTFNGLHIIQTTLCVETRTEFKVSRWMTRDKKRKNWRVLRIDHRKPCAYQAGNTLYMHPELFAKLKDVAR